MLEEAPRPPLPLPLPRPRSAIGMEARWEVVVVKWVLGEGITVRSFGFCEKIGGVTCGQLAFYIFWLYSTVFRQLSHYIY